MNFPNEGLIKYFTSHSSQVVTAYLEACNLQYKPLARFLFCTWFLSCTLNSLQSAPSKFWHKFSGKMVNENSGCEPKVCSYTGQRYLCILKIMKLQRGSCDDNGAYYYMRGCVQAGACASTKWWTFYFSLISLQKSNTSGVLLDPERIPPSSATRLFFFIRVTK